MNNLLKLSVLLMAAMTGGCAVYEVSPVHAPAVVHYPHSADVYYHHSTTYVTPAPVVVAPASARVVLAPAPAVVQVRPTTGHGHHAAQPQHGHGKMKHKQGKGHKGD